MPLTVLGDYIGEASAGTIPDGNTCLVPLGISVISTRYEGVRGNGSHLFQIYGGVYGEMQGIIAGNGNNLANLNTDKVIVFDQGIVSGNQVGINFYGFRSIVENHGSIFGQFQAVRLYNAQPGAKLIVKNYGDISGTSAVVYAEGGSRLDVRNFGTISADGASAISSIDGSGDRIYNRGTIVGDINLISLAAQITNRGVINGNIVLADGSNLIDNRSGTVDGTITFGIGDDFLRPGIGIEVAEGGSGSDTLDFSVSGVVQLALDASIIATGAAKDDTYTGFENLVGSISGNDVLIGDEQANVISGLNGADRLLGQAGTDTLGGGLGSDTLDGGAGSDVLNGDAGNDFLLGGLGNDMLAGGDGLDSLTGGLGSDGLTGGAGADQFIFLRSDFAGLNQNTPDRIFDFSKAEGDRIDLSALGASTKVAGNQAFTFIGSAAFSKVAGELRFEQVNSATFVQGDVNGDGVKDFTIKLETLVTLAATDFVL